MDGWPRSGSRTEVSAATSSRYSAGLRTAATQRIATSVRCTPVSVSASADPAAFSTRCRKSASHSSSGASRSAGTRSACRSSADASASSSPTRSSPTVCSPSCMSRSRLNSQSSLWS